jgi:hypothetical protein
MKPKREENKMSKKQILITIFFALVAFTVPAQAGLVTVIHGLPALPGALPSNNPVDIAIDGVCKYFYAPYGAKIGPSEFEDGKHYIIFYEAIPDEPCRGTILAARDWIQKTDDEIDVVLGLSSEDEVAISFWDNTTALDEVDGGVEAAIEVRHVAGGSTLGAVVKKGKRQVDGVVANGDTFGPVKTTKSDHILQIRDELEILDQDTDTLKKDRVYWVYITGSVAKKTVNILNIESVPDEAIGGECPPEHRRGHRKPYKHWRYRHQK